MPGGPAVGVDDDLPAGEPTVGVRAAEEFVRTFDFRPAAMIERLQLRRPIYRHTTNYGHFGKPGLSWEE